MRGNVFKCSSRVIIEGNDVGPFEDIEVQQERDSLAQRCTLKLPIYAIGFNSGLAPSDRIRAKLADINIKPGASIQIYTWYESIEVLEQEFEEVLQFSGFIKEIINGFPTTLICEDHAFILRFGTIGRDWKSRTSLGDMLEYLLPIANEGFEEFRDKQGFENNTAFNHLYFDQTNSADVEFALQVFKNISPFDALEKLMRLFTLYAHVFDDGATYFGIGILEREKQTVILYTGANVIDRDIVPQSGLFVNYKVVVSGLVADGTRYTYEYGDSEGTAERLFCPLNTTTGIEQYAHSVMERLRGDRNKGTITTVLYPDIRLFDYIQYEDSLYPDLDGGYYVIGRNFKGDGNGFIQTLTVTDELFIL